jgi:hypothetical protein
MGPDGGATLNDVVLRSVDLGYRVINEYIRQGEKAAKRLNDRTYGMQSMGGDFQDMAAQMARFTSDATALWLDAFQAVSRGGWFMPAAGAGTAATPKARAPQPAMEPGPQTGSEPARVRLQVVSAIPTEVSFDLQPEAAGRPLIVHSLRAVDPESPRLTEVGFRPATDGESASLHVRVPPGQPPGVYNGLIVDERTSRPVGSLSVRVLPDE